MADGQRPWKIAIIINATLHNRSTLHAENVKRFNHGKGFVIGHQWTNIVLFFNDILILLPPKDERIMPEDEMGVSWNLTRFFPQFNGTDFIEYKKTLAEDIRFLFTDAAQVGTLNRKSAPSWERLVLRWEEVFVRLGHLSAYIDALSATVAADEAYGREQADVNVLEAEFEKFIPILGAALNRATVSCRRAFLARRHLRDVSFPLVRIARQAAVLMSPERESLAADLNVTGLKAWEKLYNALTGKLTFSLKFPAGQREERPISQLRNLLADSNPVTRAAAYEGGARAWASIEDCCAAALNAISGTRLTLQRHRKIDHFLDTALFHAGIEKNTLQAMYAAVNEKLDLVKGIYRIRARALGTTGIRFFEREAALPLENPDTLSWPTATRMLLRAFETVYPDLCAHYLRMLENRWIDSLSKFGKRPGAFCVGSKQINEQRVHMNFTGTFADLTTLAHEVGHAWHAHLLKSHRPLVQRYPMTLAETASSFAEQLLFGSLMRDDEMCFAKKLRLLDTDLSSAAVLILDITTRFEFEKRLYTERCGGEVSVARLKEMMIVAQRRVYGDVLLPDGTDPLFWASKLHFYLTGVEFYNFPYTFGFLLARALYCRFAEEGPSFLPRYERFLRQSGSDTVEETIRKTLDIDITKIDFWAEALEGLRIPIERYEKLVAATVLCTPIPPTDGRHVVPGSPG